MRWVFFVSLVISSSNLFAGFVERCIDGDTDVRAAIYFNWDEIGQPEFPDDCAYGFEKLRLLTEVHFSYVDHLDFIEELPHIEKLSIDKTHLKSIASIKSLVKLRDFTLKGDHDFRNVSLHALRSLPQLRSLTLIDNHMTSLAFLQDLPKLEKLEISHNQISDLAPIQFVTNLNYLIARDNRISHLHPLRALRKLQNADFAHNLIRREQCLFELEGYPLQREICDNL